MPITTILVAHNENIHSEPIGFNWQFWSLLGMILAKVADLQPKIALSLSQGDEYSNILLLLTVNTLQCQTPCYVCCEKAPEKTPGRADGA
jgi:hypothetical protein